jgi:O-antigen ligase
VAGFEDYLPDCIQGLYQQKCVLKGNVVTEVLASGTDWKTYRNRLLFWLNTALIGWFFIALSSLNLNPATSGLLLLALLAAWPALKHAPQIWHSQRGWILALILYGAFMLVYFALEDSSDPSRLDRPARFVAMALVVIYLLRFGFCARFLWLAVMLGTLVGTGIGLHEVFVQGLQRAGAGFYPITFGYLMTAMSLLCFFYACYEKALVIRLLMALSGVIGVLGAFSSGTRGVVVIFAAVFAFALLRWLWRKRISWRWLVAGIAVLSLTLFASYQWMPQAKRAVDQTHWELKQIQSGNLNTSFGTRLQMWSVALHHGVQNPLTGVGHDLDRMRALSQPFIEEKGLNTHALQYSHFHSVYLEAFAKRGIPGVLVFVLLMVAAAWGMKTHYRDAVLMILSVFVVGGLTEAVMNSGRLLYLLMVGVTLFRCLDYFEWRRQQQGGVDSTQRGVHA